MRKFSSRAVLGCVVALSLMVIGCGQVANLRAKMAFREANGLYQAGDWVTAVEKYEEVVAMNPTDPQLMTTYFFLGNSYDNQYSPGRANDPANDALLTRAIENYKRAAEVLRDNPEMRTLSLQYLVAAYGPDKLNDPSLAEPLLHEMILETPDNAPNYFMLSRLYEDGGDYENFTAADCVPVTGDHQRCEIVWKTQRSLDALKGKYIRLKISGRNVIAYSASLEK